MTYWETSIKEFKPNLITVRDPDVSQGINLLVLKYHSKVYHSTRIFMSRFENDRGKNKVVSERQIIMEEY